MKRVAARSGERPPWLDDALVGPRRDLTPVSYPDPTRKHRHANTSEPLQGGASGIGAAEPDRELQGYYSDGRPVNLAEALRREVG